MLNKCDRLLNIIKSNYQQRTLFLEDVFDYTIGIKILQLPDNTWLIQDILRFHMFKHLDWNWESALVLLFALVKLRWLKTKTNLKIRRYHPMLNQFLDIFAQIGFPEGVHLGLSRISSSQSWLQKLIQAISVGWFSKNMELDLTWSNISAQDIWLLSNVIAQKSFEEDVVLLLWNNDIGDEWLMYLSEAIKKAGLPKRLVLHQTNIWDVWFCHLVDAMRQCDVGQDTMISVDWNAITDIWAQYLLDFVIEKWSSFQLIIHMPKKLISWEMQARFKEMHEHWVYVLFP